MKPALFLSFVSLLGAPALLTAQQGRLVVPPEYTSTEAPGSTGFGWGQGTTQRRVQWIYDSSYFTNNGVDHPILVNRLRWRANGASTVATGTYSTATVSLASAAVDCLSPSTTFASNLGPDLTTVYSGTVTVAAGQGLTPNNWYVDLQLQTPFLYNPTLGADLVTEITIPTGSLTGSTPIHDAAFNSSATPPLNILGGRVQSTTATATTGTTLVGGLVVLEFGFDYPPGVANGQRYGNGCYDTAMSWYELFPNGGFDLANAGVRMTSAGNTYLVGGPTGTWFTPVAAPLAMGDDTISPTQLLPFNFPYFGGTTSTVQVCSNGYLLLVPTTATTGQFNATSAALLNGPVRFAPAWTDWNPSAGGSIHFDVVPGNQSVVITWSNVPEFQQTTLNSFQVELDAFGNVEYRYQTVANVARQLLVGWTQGTPARDPGSRDLTTALPFLAQPDGLGLQLGLTGRPRIGQTCNLVTSSFPSGATLGATFLSFTSYPAGLPLASLGLPGCSQYAGLDSTQVFFVTGSTASIPLTLPSQPSFAGLHVYGQSLAFAPGINLLGAVTSNGIDLTVDVQ
ncbi:MAG: hypothetical protein RIT25_1001 [Planctomycetota bacterium]